MSVCRAQETECVMDVRTMEMRRVAACIWNAKVCLSEAHDLFVKANTVKVETPDLRKANHSRQALTEERKNDRLQAAV